MEGHLRGLVCYYLDSYLLENAAFLGERLAAAYPCEENLFLLATCHARQGDRGKLRAHAILAGCKSEKCKYLFAHCAFELGKLKEAERALLDGTRVLDVGLEACEADLLRQPCPIPNGAAGLHLLGCICQSESRLEQAARYYEMSLSIDPMLWTSYEALCDLGLEPDPSKFFGVLPDVPILAQKFGTLPLQQLSFKPTANGFPTPKVGAGGGAGAGNAVSRGKGVETDSGAEKEFADISASSVKGPGSFSSPGYRLSPSNCAWAHSTMTIGGGGRSRLMSPSSLLVTPDVGASPGFGYYVRGDFANRGGGQYGQDTTTPGPSMQSSAMVTGDSHPHGHVPMGIGGGAGAGGRTGPLFADGNMSGLTPIPSQESPQMQSPTPASNNSSQQHQMPGNDIDMDVSPMVYAVAGGVGRGGGAGGERALTYDSPAPVAPARAVSNEQKSERPTTRSRARPPVPAFTVTPALVTAPVQPTETMDSGQEPANMGGEARAPQKRSVTWTGLSGDSSQSQTNEYRPQHIAAEGGGSSSGYINSQGQNNHYQNNHDVYEQGGHAMQQDYGGVDEEAAKELLDLLCLLGTAYHELSKYQCLDAIKSLHKLPPSQFNTGWVQHQVGRAYFCMGDYEGAIQAFKYMSQFEPHRLEGLELLSSSLWHLDRQVDLCYLAQRVMEFDRLDAGTWCIVGNCFSKQKEHEQALRFFQRAIQLCPQMAYAHALCGHEYALVDNLDKALACYRTAITIDKLHYNGWFGLGEVYERQERYALAEIHFKQALKINPQCSPLRCHLAAVLCSNKRYKEALELLSVTPSSAHAMPPTRFERARVLEALERYEEALTELEAVRDAVPKESSVHFWMGRICKKLGRLDEAVRHFTVAQDLNPKDNALRSALERLNEPDNELDDQGVGVI